MSELKADLFAQKCVATRTVYFVSLPTEDAHTGHPTCNGVTGLSQKMNEKVAAKIAELVAEGITEFHDVRRLRIFRCLCWEHCTYTRQGQKLTSRSCTHAQACENKRDCTHSTHLSIQFVSGCHTLLMKIRYLGLNLTFQELPYFNFIVDFC